MTEEIKKKNLNLFFKKLEELGVDTSYLKEKYGMNLFNGSFTNSNEFGNAYDGSLIEIVLKVLTPYAVRINELLPEEKRADKGTLVKLCLLHQIAKAVRLIPNDNQWEVEKRGLVYKYNSNHEFINNNFKIANIEKINNWEEILEKWNNLKKEYNTLINGLLYSCAESNKYADMQLCNLLQSIDAISGKLFNTDLDVNKVAYIDKVINELPKSNNNYKENLIDVLNDSKNWSFKERIEKFLNLDCYNIFYIENKLFELCKMQKKNPKNCMIFSRKNQMIRRSINERNKFSHMNSNNEKSFDDNIRKYYYFKYLFLCRTILIEKIDFKDAIDSNMIIEDIKHWTNYFMNIEKDKCKECPYYKDKKCAIIKEGY